MSQPVSVDRRSRCFVSHNRIDECSAGNLAARSALVVDWSLTTVRNQVADLSELATSSAYDVPVGPACLTESPTALFDALHPFDSLTVLVRIDVTVRRNESRQFEQKLSEIGSDQFLATSISQNLRSLLKLSAKLLLNDLFCFDKSHQNRWFNRRQRRKPLLVKLFEFELDWFQSGQKLHGIMKQCG